MRVLFSPLGMSPGSLFTAISRMKPERVVVLTSSQAASGLPAVEAAARSQWPEFSLESHVLEDPFCGFRQGRELAERLATRAGADNVVNLTGGTTALQYAIQRIAQLVTAREIAVVDRRSIEEQRREPFVLGELVELPAALPVIESAGDPFTPLCGLPHLIIASGQTLPSILAMKELGARDYVLVHTSEEPPDRLARACTSFGFTSLMPPIEIPAYGAAAVEARSVELAARLASEGRRVVLNYTPGTKQMALGLLAGFQRGTGPRALAGAIYVERGRMLYCSQRGNDAQQPLHTRLSVDEILRANGILEQTRKTPSGLVFSAVDPLTADDLGAARQVAAKLTQFEAACGKLRAKGLHRSRQAAAQALRPFGPVMMSPQRFLNGTWLEAFAFGVLDRHRSQLGIDDIRWSVTVGMKAIDGTTKQHTDLDVCFAAHNALGFISCKTGEAEALTSEVLAVAARMGQYGGTFGRGMLLHWHPDNGPRVASTREMASSLRPPVPVLGRDAIANEDTLVQRVLSIVH